MRIELAGSLLNVDPLILQFSENEDFNCLSYIELGYTHFDVICIGAGGGSGGGIDTANTGTSVVNYGGKGGGGGFHRVQGLLTALPDECFVVVGAAGTPGISHDSNVTIVTDGGDGGISSFNDDTCRASGGKGGKRVQSNSTVIGTVADGGEGGIGNRILAGGGASGGQAGIPTDTGPGTPGVNGGDGALEDNIGAGGGGGAGGVGKYGSGGTTCVAATAGGRGSYNPSDIAVYGPGSDPSDDGGSGSLDVVPGGASGAKAIPINGLPTVYGQSDNPGTVIIRLLRQ